LLGRLENSRGEGEKVLQEARSLPGKEGVGVSPGERPIIRKLRGSSQKKRGLAARKHYLVKRKTLSLEKTWS